VHENRQQILAQEQKKPESSLAKKISGFQNERAAKIGVLNDTVKEEICRIATAGSLRSPGPAPGTRKVVSVHCPLKHRPLAASGLISAVSAELF